MRKPLETKVPRSTAFPQGKKFTGPVRHLGRQRWVPGAYGHVNDWRAAARKVMREIEDEIEAEKAGLANRAAAPTVAVFAGVCVEPDGRVVPRDASRDIWPWTHTRGGSLRKESAKRRYAEALRKFVRTHGDRPMDSFDRRTAREWQDGAAQYEREAVRRLFADALDDEVITGANPFRGAGAKKRRKDDPDFRVATDEEFERVLAAALSSRTDDYARTLHAMCMLVGESAMRPGEIFALQHENVHAAQGWIDVRWAMDDRGAITPVKNELIRQVPMSPRMVDAYLRAPRLSERWAFPAPRGGHFKLSSWSPYWKSVKVAAGLPDLPFYELKHRAITWMVTPPESGGLGLDPPTVAIIVGHQDAGRTIARHYLKLDEAAARDRVRKAMVAREAQARHLHVVGE